MNEFIALLLSRYTEVIGSKPSDSTLTAAFNSLRFADALLDKQRVSDCHPEHPHQIVVLGPTQAGKSTLVNVLLDASVAGISALAGYTVHAQGFATFEARTSLESIQPVLSPLELVASDQIDHNNLSNYTLDTVKAGPSAIARNSVVWDSPDFDSIESNGYRGAVLKTAALADVAIVMVSKDKYADKTVWEMLTLLNDSGVPHFVCINKLDANDQAIVESSFLNRYQETFSREAQPLVLIPYIPASNGSGRNTRENRSVSDNTLALSPDTCAKLGTALQEKRAQVCRSARTEFTHSFVETHWESWLAPVRLENQAQASWELAIDTALQNAMEEYDRRYLENPQKYDTFNRALAELLTLLEIPGLAKGLATTRSIVTWPARKLFGIGKRAISGDSTAHGTDYEQQMLERICDHAFTDLQGHIFSQASEITEQTNWWTALGSRFSDERQSIANDFQAGIQQYQLEFAPRIDEAAERLYTKLKDQPALLNTLRATRVTTDAAAVVLAVKSGGLAAADLVIAPAMLSVTSLLTESVLGRYMTSIKNELKEQQYAVVEISLFKKIVQKRLERLISTLDQSSVFGIEASAIPEIS